MWTVPARHPTGRHPWSGHRARSGGDGVRHGIPGNGHVAGDFRRPINPTDRCLLDDGQEFVVPIQYRVVGTGGAHAGRTAENGGGDQQPGDAWMVGPRRQGVWTERNMAVFLVAQEKIDTEIYLYQICCLVGDVGVQRACKLAASFGI